MTDGPKTRWENTPRPQPVQDDTDQDQPVPCRPTEPEEALRLLRLENDMADMLGTLALHHERLVALESHRHTPEPAPPVADLAVADLVQALVDACRVWRTTIRGLIDSGSYSSLESWEAGLFDTLQAIDDAGIFTSDPTPIEILGGGHPRDDIPPSTPGDTDGS